MSGALKLPLPQLLRAVRLHPRAPSAADPAAAKVHWLLSLGEGARRREAEHLALMATLQGLQQALAGVPARLQAAVDQVAALAVELGLGIARELVGAALEQGRVDPTPTVVRCLRDCVRGVDGEELRLWLHPQDLGPVLDRLAGAAELRPLLQGAQLLPDPALPRGAVRAETTAGGLRYAPREVLERICAEVRREAGR